MTYTTEEILEIQNQFKQDFNSLPAFIKEMNMFVDNQLPMLPQHFTLTQKRILGYAIALIKVEDREKTESELSKTKFTIQVSNFKKAFNLKQQNGRLYLDLKEACNDLMDQKTTVINKKEKFTHVFNWCQDVKYIDKEGRIEINFTEAIAEFLTKLTKNFTKYNLFVSHSFKSVYTVRIYEMLQTRKDTNIKKMSFNEFKRVLQLPDSYKTPALIKAQILKKVQDELNTKLDLGFEFEFRRDKRFEGNFEVILKANKNEENVLSWLYEKNEEVEVITTNKKNIKSKKIENVFIESNDDLPFLTDFSKIIKK